MNKIIRCFILLVGLMIAHFGVTLYLLVDFGADPFNVLVQGIYRTLDNYCDLTWITHGNVHIVICLLIIAILLYCGEKLYQNRYYFVHGIWGTDY